MVYENIISDTNSNKYPVCLLSVNITSAGNKLREYLTYTSATSESGLIIVTADRNISTGPTDTCNGGSTSRNTSMDVADGTGEYTSLVVALVVDSTMD